MAKSWNPSAPPKLGFEWLLGAGADSLLQSGAARDLIMPSTQAEAMSGFAAQIRDTGGAVADPPSTLLEIFDQGQESVTGPVLTYVARPNADAGGDIGAPNWRKYPGALIVNLWDAIDEPVVYPPTDTSSHIASEGGTTNQYRFHLNMAGLPGTARVTRMKVRMVCSAQHISGPYGNRKFTLRVHRISDGATRTPAQGGTLWATGYTTLFEVNLGEINPFTDLPWTAADMQQFDGGDYALRVETIASAGVVSVLMAAELEVEYVTENRLACAVWRRPGSQASGTVQSTALITMATGAAGWAKPGSGTHVYRWRIPTNWFDTNPSSGTTYWRTGAQRLNAAAIEPGPHGVAAQTVAIDVRGLQAGAAVASEFVPNLHVLVAGAPSTDSQPYWLAPEAPFIPASAATSVGQRFTPGSTQAYLAFRYIIRPPAEPFDGTLTLSIRRTSDNVQMGGSHTITADEARALPDIEAGTRVKMVAGFLSASTGSLVSGTQYEFRWTVTGASAWDIPDARADGAGAVSFGGFSSCRYTRTEPGGVVTTNTNRDIPAVLLQQPPPPTGAVADVMLSPTRMGADCFCGVDGIENVVVNWVSAAVSGFAWTEIERFIDDVQGGGDWHLVAQKFSNPTAGSFTDREVPRGAPARYRMRYLDTNGSFSEWAETGWATPQARGCEIIFTSNEQPDLTVVYQHEPQVSYELRGFRNDVLMEVDGADYQMAFVERENRGISDTRRVIANFGRPPCDDTGRPIGKRRIFQPLYDAARWGGIPYVCVLDSDGNRTFAYVSLDRAISDEPGFRYHLDATVVPITGTPRPVFLP